MAECFPTLGTFVQFNTQTITLFGFRVGQILLRLREVFQMLRDWVVGIKQVTFQTILIFEQARAVWTSVLHLGSFGGTSGRPLLSLKFLLVVD